MLGIQNRSESWRISNRLLSGGETLVENLSEKILLNVGLLASGETELELFWTGFRDFCHSKPVDTKVVVFKKRIEKYYRERYDDLYDRIDAYNQENTPKLKIDSSKYNYILRPESLNSLIANLYHTEIDIVISAGDYLLIGEVKSEIGFGANSKYVLVHQLIRQYVMATILMDMLNEQEQKIAGVIPFVISEKDISNTAQSQFMVTSGWLNPSNLLNWRDLDSIS